MSACKCQDGAEERALCMDSKGPPRRVERTRRGIYLRGDQVSDDPISYTDDLLEKILAELVTIRTILLTTPR